MTNAQNEQVSKGEIKSRVMIVNKRGLHARAAASFVKTAGEFDADITVHKSGNTVSGISIMGLMMLAAPRGTELLLEVEGTDAESAMTDLCDLVASGFGEGVPEEDGA